MSLKFDRELVTEKFSKKNDSVHFSLENKSLEQKIKLLILCDLWNIDCQVKIDQKKIQIIPPDRYNKETIKGNTHMVPADQSFTLQLKVVNFDKHMHKKVYKNRRFSEELTEKLWKS